MISSDLGRMVVAICAGSGALRAPGELSTFRVSDVGGIPLAERRSRLSKLLMIPSPYLHVKGALLDVARKVVDAISTWQW